MEVLLAEMEGPVLLYVIHVLSIAYALKSSQAKPVKWVSAILIEFSLCVPMQSNFMLGWANCDTPA